MVYFATPYKIHWMGERQHKLSNVIVLLQTQFSKFSQIWFHPTIILPMYHTHFPPPQSFHCYRSTIILPLPLLLSIPRLPPPYYQRRGDDNREDVNRGVSNKWLAHFFVPTKGEMTMKGELLSKNSYQNLVIIVCSFVRAMVFTLHTTTTITTTMLHINNIYIRQTEHFKLVCGQTPHTKKQQRQPKINQRWCIFQLLKQTTLTTKGELSLNFFLLANILLWQSKENCH